MKATIRTIPIGVALALLVSAGTSHAQSLNETDCNAARPPVASPGDAAADKQPGAASPDLLTEQLSTCGSVLNPPAVGDPDVVQPAPVIDDPLAIHPQDPQLNKK